MSCGGSANPPPRITHNASASRFARSSSASYGYGCSGLRVHSHTLPAISDSPFAHSGHAMLPTGTVPLLAEIGAIAARLVAPRETRRSAPRAAFSHSASVGNVTRQPSRRACAMRGGVDGEDLSSASSQRQYASASVHDDERHRMIIGGPAIARGSIDHVPPARTSVNSPTVTSCRAMKNAGTSTPPSTFRRRPTLVVERHRIARAIGAHRRTARRGSRRRQGQGLGTWGLGLGHEQ